MDFGLHLTILLFFALCCVVFVLLSFIAALRIYIHEFCYDIDSYNPFAMSVKLK